jgi:hypothetical protein
MSNKSNNNGRAFEYACIKELERSISKYRPVIVNKKSIEASKRAWLSINKEQQEKLILASKAFINLLFDAEPLIIEYKSTSDVVELLINKDSDAEAGDVRDIIIKRAEISWDVGLSMKHNHFAAKHSRLSAKIDFGNKWYGLPCSKEYWTRIKPIFDNLCKLKEDRCAWHDMSEKENTVYLPLLNAFMQEINRANQLDYKIPQRLISYLLGVKDFYKVVSVDRKELTEFQCFNLRGELNKSGIKDKAKVVIPIADLPNEILVLRLKPNSTNTVEMFLNNGWSLSFRIHNASTIVEPSLKFDIQFVGVPSNIITINCKWSKGL